MKFTLRSVEQTATGREIVRDRQVEADEIIIGRRAECHIHLPDLAVEPHHAVITPGEGVLVVQAVGTLGFTIDGRDETAAEIDPAVGAELGFGTYRITFSTEDEELLLTVRRLDEAATRSGDLEGKRGFSLQGVLPSKRVMSWTLAGAILLFLLALPVISHALFDPGDKDSTVIGDASWSTGDLRLAHHGLEDQCEACHVDAFVSVRDETCVSCHTDVHDHADPSRLDAARADRSLGTRFLWSVANMFGKEGPGSCADCHIEHEGQVRLSAPPQKFCADCHSALDRSLADTRLGNAGDFGTQHPQFTAAVILDPVMRKQVAVSLDKNPRENNGLAFPHALHLDPLGGVSRMAANIGAERGYQAGGMRCMDCHRPTSDGVRFEPIKMERDCEGCHSLSYERVGGIFRKLTHGDVDQLIADLAMTSPTRSSLSARQRPGIYSRGGPYHFGFSAPVWKGLQLYNALSSEGICGECHQPMFDKNGKPGVVPVMLPVRYMHQGWFDHAAHKQEKCESCHAATASRASSDLLLPGIKDCRTCHMGEAAKDADVPSSCAMCHNYHLPDRGWRDPVSLKRR